MTASHLRSDLQESRERLFGLIRGLSEEHFRHVPASHSAESERPGDTWSIAAHLAHLLRIERVFAERATRARHEDTPFIPSTAALNDDDPALAQHLAVPQIIHGMQASRRDLLTLLEGGDALLERAIQHERIGRMTIADILAKMAAHEREHADDVERLAARAASSTRVTIPLTQRS